MKKKEKHNLLIYLTCLFVCLSFSANMYSQLTLLKANGTKIENESGKEIILKGVNLGSWVSQEGWMISRDGNNPGTQGEMKKILYDSGFSEDEVEAYYQAWRDNFIAKADVDYIASKGMNCIRFPMHYELFLTKEQRSVRNSVIKNKSNYQNYKNKLREWINQNALAADNTLEGFRLIDNLLSWSAANNIYVILDMHAVPGTQGTDEHIADCIATPNDLWNDAVNQDALNAIWLSISKRYKNNATVAMYNLINEPNNANKQAMRSVYQRLINTIRNNGDNHLILLEGDGWGNNYTNCTPDLFTPRTNLVYSLHRYDNDYTGTSVNDTHSDPNQIQQLGNARAFRDKYQVPLFCGETGLTNNQWMRANIESLNSLGIGWAVWSYKWHTNWAAARGGFGQIKEPLPANAKTKQTMDQVLENIKFANMIKNEDQEYWTILNATSPEPEQKGPYQGSPWAIPGTIEAENFDKGGEGVSYHDSDAANNGGQYRPNDGVDIENKTGGGYNVGYTATGEWLEYTVDIKKTGIYTISLTVAAESAGGGVSVRFGGVNKTGTMQVSPTGGWQNWATIEKSDISLNAGVQLMRVYIEKEGFNLDKITITEKGGTTPEPGVCQNILLGGNMENSNLWNVSSLNSSLSPAVQWNYTSNTPKDGEGGALHLKATASPGGGQVQYCIYQQVNLEDKTYDFDGAIKILSFQTDRFFLEAYVSKTKPENGSDFNQDTPSTTCVLKMGVWNNDGRFDDIDDTFSNFLGNEEDKMITSFTAEKDAYYFVLKVGIMTWDDASKSYEIILDELSLKAKNCDTGLGICENSDYNYSLFTKNGQIIIEGNKIVDKNEAVSIFDLSGRKVNDGRISNGFFISKQLAEGLYIVQTADIVQKIVVR